MMKRIFEAALIGGCWLATYYMWKHQIIGYLIQSSKTPEPMSNGSPYYKVWIDPRDIDTSHFAANKNR